MSTKSIIGFVLGTVAILILVVGLLWKFGSTSGETVISDVAGEEKHVLGQGAVTIVEFSDLQCPACQSVQAPLKELMKKYDGKVKIVYRHLPLTSLHKNAQIAAQAAEAAHIQGKFWEMHDLLFAKQNDWAQADNPVDKFADYAKELGLDSDKLKTDINSQEAKDAVNRDMVDATRFKLSATPTFFVNGVKTDFNQLQLKIEELIQ